MDFGDAIRALKEGKRVSRAGWSGNKNWRHDEPGRRAMWLFLSDGDTIEFRTLGDLKTAEYPVSQSICLKTRENTIVVGWLASQTDMLADDWEVVDA